MYLYRESHGKVSFKIILLIIFTTYFYLKNVCQSTRKENYHRINFSALVCLFTTQHPRQVKELPSPAPIWSVPSSRSQVDKQFRSFVCVRGTNMHTQHPSPTHQHRHNCFRCKGTDDMKTSPKVNNYIRGFILTQHTSQTLFLVESFIISSILFK
jgi:hypothetical protein